jgi:hypothetical protein
VVSDDRNESTSDMSDEVTEDDSERDRLESETLPDDAELFPVEDDEEDELLDELLLLISDDSVDDDFKDDRECDLDDREVLREDDRSESPLASLFMPPLCRDIGDANPREERCCRRDACAACDSMLSARLTQ